MVEGPAQVAGLQVVAAAEDRLVQEGEHGLGPLAGCAANLAGAAQGFDEQVEPLAVTPQFGVAIDPAGDQSGLQQREPAEPAVVDLIEQPLLQRGEPRCENLRSAGRDGQFSRVGQHVGHHVPMVVVGDALARAVLRSLLRRADPAGQQCEHHQPPQARDLELLIRSHRNAYGEVAGILDCGAFSGSGTSNHCNNSTLRNGHPAICEGCGLRSRNQLRPFELLLTVKRMFDILV